MIFLSEDIIMTTIQDKADITLLNREPTGAASPLTPLTSC